MYEEGDDRGPYHHRKTFTTYERPRRSDQHSYHDHRRTNQYRNNIHNDGFVQPREDMGRRTDAFNNWKPSREERWKENKGRGVYERRESHHDDFSSISLRDGTREHDRRQNSHHHNHSWRDEKPQEMPKPDTFISPEPVVDEWGREVRTRTGSFSSNDGLEHSQAQPRAAGETRYGNGYYNGGEQYSNMKKRRREEHEDTERWSRGSAQTSSNIFPHPRSRTPPKKPRIERSPSPQFHHHSYQKNRFNHSNDHFHDRTHPTTAIPSNSAHRYPSSIPDAPRALTAPSNFQKGNYTRNQSRNSYPSTPAASMRPSAGTNAMIAKEQKNFHASANPPITKPTTNFKIAKPEKSALVRKFFMDDDDDDDSENIPTPVPRTGPALASSDYATRESKQSAGVDKLTKERTSPKLPPSPISHSPSSSTHVDSNTIVADAMEDAAMDISPVDDTATPNSPPPSKPPSTTESFSAPLAPPDTVNATASSSQSNSSTPIPPPVQEPFEFLDLVGAGSYGKVFKARDVLKGKLVALKKIKMEGQIDGFPVTSLREIKLLQSLRHENVVTLQEMVVRKGSVFLSFEYLEHDLAGLLKQSEFELKAEHIKSLAQQLCEGLSYIHGRSVLHRDLKTANLLVTSTGVLKLADFGLARFFNKRRTGRCDYTNRVCTQWYRPPELMLGETIYGPEVDMWSAGCIFMELFLKRVPFHAEDEIDQLQLVYSILGTPNGDYAPMLMQKPWFSLITPMEGCVNCFRDEFKILPEDALNFAERLLCMDGSQRLSAALALQDIYFTSEPLPVRPDLTNIKSDCHEFEAIRVDKEAIKEREQKEQREQRERKMQPKQTRMQPPPDKQVSEAAKNSRLIPP